MRGLMQDDAVLTANAYLAWWQTAGVDCAVAETPHNWLRPVAVANSAQIAPSASDAPPPVKPQDLASFHDWLNSESDHPETRWPGRRIMPVGAVGAPLMVVTDMPDPADVDAGNLLADRAGQLFDAMLRAIDLDRSQIYIASLFFARPPGGMVEAADMASAAARMRTHVHLAQPRRLLLLGDRTIRTLLPTSDLTTNDSLRDFNHDGGTLSVVATFHPRLLLGQPAAKAECWRALQSLTKEDRP